jgi:homeobox protein cut-like
LERERSALTNRVSSLEMQVANSPSQDVVDKMRHELRILKRLEYNAVDYDHRDPEMTHPDIAGKDDDLEAVLVAKLRKIEAELVRERREKSEGHKARDELNQRLLAVQKSLDDAQELIASLENDLLMATPTSFISTPVRGEGGDVVPYGSTNAPDPNTLQRILDPTAPPVPPQDAGAATATTSAPSAAPSEKAQDDHSVATIIMAQRDRLRARCDMLEAERDSFKRELQMQVQTSEGMKTDNSKLYEKVRLGVSLTLLGKSFLFSFSLTS